MTTTQVRTAMALTTAYEIPGRPLIAIRGMVCGCIAIRRDPYHTGVQRPGDGSASPDAFHELRRRRYLALREMVRQALLRDANAVIGVRFDSREIGWDWMELCAYGTAVVAREPELVPLPAPRRGDWADLDRYPPAGRPVDPAGEDERLDLDEPTQPL